VYYILVLIAVIVFLEISGKWPDDIEAIQAIKAEFHSKMADSLLKDNVVVQLFPQYLQILWVSVSLVWLPY